MTWLHNQWRHDDKHCGEPEAAIIHMCTILYKVYKLIPLATLHCIDVSRHALLFTNVVPLAICHAGLLVGGGHSSST